MDSILLYFNGTIVHILNRRVITSLSYIPCSSAFYLHRFDQGTASFSVLFYILFRSRQPIVKLSSDTMALLPNRLVRTSLPIASCVLRNVTSQGTLKFSLIQQSNSFFNFKRDLSSSSGEFRDSCFLLCLIRLVTSLWSLIFWGSEYLTTSTFDYWTFNCPAINVKSDIFSPLIKGHPKIRAFETEIVVLCMLIGVEHCVSILVNSNLNNQLKTYYLPVCYLLRIQQYPVNTTYNSFKVLWVR